MIVLAELAGAQAGFARGAFSGCRSAPGLVACVRVRGGRNDVRSDVVVQ